MRKQQHLANPPPSLHEYFSRFYYIESTIGLWLTIGIGVLVFGVLVHINLDFVIGVAIVVVGLLILVLALVSALLWTIYGELSLEKFLKSRRIILGFKLSLIVILVGLSTWASVVMFKRSV
jgi:hypothetical protein